MLNKFFKNNEIVYSSNLSLSWLSKGYFGSSKMLKVKSSTGDKLFLGISKIKNNEIIFNNFLYSERKKIIDNIFNKIPELREFLLDFINKNNLDFGLEFNIYSDQNIGNGFGITGTFCSLISSFLGDEIGRDNNYKINLAGIFEKILKQNSSSIDSFLPFNSEKGLLLIILSKQKSIKVLSRSNDYIDYIVIDSGFNVKQDLSEKIINNDLNYLENLNNNFNKNFLNTDSNNDFSEIISIGENIKNSFSSIFHLINIRIINSFNKVFSEIYNEKNIENLFKDLNSQKNILFLLSEQTQFYTDLKRNFELLKSNKQEKIAIIPHYSGRTGGSFLLCFKSGISKNTISKLESKMKEYYTDSRIVYKSYEDSYITKGIKIEQNIGKNIFSDSLKKSKILKTSYKSIIVDDLEESLNLGFDIIFDQINNDIYIDGNKLTSKDIHSRTTAIILFDVLLDKLSISNTDLPRSSYSLSKSEMGGKIIYPIRNLLEKILNKKINLEITGKSTNFNIELDIGDLKIGILKNI